MEGVKIAEIAVRGTMCDDLAYVQVLPSAMSVHCDNYVSLFFFLLQNWNAYIGKLGRKDFCFNISKTEMSGARLEDVPSLSSILSDDIGERHTVGVMINFTLDKAVLTSAKEAAENTILHGTFTGNDFTTQIKGRYACNCHISAFKSW